MRLRQLRKIVHKWERAHAFRPGYFLVYKISKLRRGEVLANLNRQLDDAMEYHYGKYCR